jgi:hypothetical protein
MKLLKNLSFNDYPKLIFSSLDKKLRIEERFEKAIEFIVSFYGLSVWIKVRFPRGQDLDMCSISPNINYLKFYEKHRHFDLEYNNYLEFITFYKNYLLETLDVDILGVKKHFNMKLFEFYGGLDINFRFSFKNNKRRLSF